VPSFSHLQREVEQMYDNAFRSFSWPLTAMVPNLRNIMPQMQQQMQQQIQQMQMFQPQVNIASTNDEYSILVEVPGMEERDIKLDISPDGILTISGEKRQENEDKDKDYEFMECSYGFFQRSLTLPDDVDQEGIEANFRNGLLTITCPRTESMRSQRRQIPVRGEGQRMERGERGEHRERERGEGHRPSPQERGEQANRGGPANMSPKKAA
jgi:HSP20 family protein